MTTNIFNVNTQACVVLVNKLEQLHKSAFPLAVRGTLNALAFDVKTRTLPESAKSHFIERSPTFFKRFTGVNRADGFNIEAMAAEVGFTREGGNMKDGLRAGPAIAGMEDQEEGGKITDGLEYLNPSRISGSADNMVTTSKRWKKDNTIKGDFKRATTTKSRMIAQAFQALKLKELVKYQKNGRNFYVAITSIRKLKKGKIKIYSKLLYSSRNDNNKPLSATHFSRQAATRTSQQMTGIFWRTEAQKQIDRIWRN